MGKNTKRPDAPHSGTEHAPASHGHDHCSCGHEHHHNHKHEPDHTGEQHSHAHDHNHLSEHEHAHSHGEHTHAHQHDCDCGHDHSGDHAHHHAAACDCGHDHSHGSVHGHAHAEVAAALHAPALELAAEVLGGRHDQLVFQVDGLDCPDCAARLAQVIGRMAGVRAADLTYATARLTVIADQSVQVRDIERRINQMGYHSRLLTRPGQQGRLRVHGLDCPDCTAKLEQQLQRLPGVEMANLSFSTGILQFAPAGAEAALVAHVTQAGYRAEILDRSSGQAEAAADTGSVGGRRVLGTVISGVFLASGWVAELLLHNTPLSRVLFLLGMVCGGYYVARSGFFALRNRTLDMNFLMTVAALGAVAIGEWHEAAMVVFLFSLGNTLQAYTMDKTRQSIHSLVKLAPKEAAVLRDGQEISLPIEAIRLGDVIIVRPGERIAMDGVVENGFSSVNQAPITGESMPVDKVAGDRVFAGTINGSGSLEIRVDRRAADNTLARIIHLVEEAQAQKAPAQALVDRFAAYYTPIVIGVAVLIAIVPPLFGAEFAEWFKRALILLVVSCPCALVISTPVSIVSAIGNASRQGVLIKGGAFLEAMGGIRTVAFDKTGTLTAGRVVLTDLIPVGAEPSTALAQAAALESRSEHPLAQAVLQAAADQELVVPTVQDFQAWPGSGVTGTVDGQQLAIGNRRLLSQLGLTISPAEARQVEQLESAGKTVVYLVSTGQILALLGFADVVRPEAAESIARLRSAGIHSVVMLTGDNRRAAQVIGQQLGVDDIRAELLPEDKVSALRQLLAADGQVAMVGDGVNDAPALAVSTVGISLGVAGTDTAIETADIALMTDDLHKLPWLVRLSRRTLAIIRQNIALSLLIKGVVLLLTLWGRSELWMGVLADTGAALLVIANGMRLMGRQRSE